jgi:cyclopropane-fatty-acyl-phospholipid synthase
MNAQNPIYDHHRVSAEPRVAARPRWVERGVAAQMHRLLDRMDAGLAAGMLTLHLPEGTTRLLGGRAEGPSAVVHIHRWRSLIRMAFSGSIGWYQSWVAGDWSSGDIVVLFALFGQNRRTLGSVARPAGLARLAMQAGHWLRRNTKAGARRNIAAHYDLGNSFYAAWLDPGMSYSSALFATVDEPLEVAQARKNAAVLGRLNLSPGDTLLEIGCGWGALAIAAARDRGVSVTALTLSCAQKAWADQSIAAAGLSDRITVAQTDYRDATGRYDAIASIEMVEAVGEAYWPAYLDAIARLLKPGGRAAIQFISIADDAFERYAASADFIQTYIFPGGMLLSASRFRVLAAARGLAWHDQHDFGADYAETLHRWRAAFDEATADDRLPPRFDAEFARLWRYYLMYCEGGFRGGGVTVSQVTLIKDQ